MVHVELPQRRPWLLIGWLVALALGAVLAFVQIYIGLLMITLATAIIVATALRSQTGASKEWRASARRSIATADNVEQVAFVVAAESTSGYKPMLTRDGYVLVNEAGTIVYTLRRDDQ